MTDQFSGYNILDKENECNFIRLKVDHTVTYSLGGGIHTNDIESFWAILKRGVYGVFHNISVKYMQNMSPSSVTDLTTGIITRRLPHLLNFQ